MSRTLVAAVILALCTWVMGPASAEPKVNKPKAPVELKKAEEKLETSQNKRSKREVNAGVKKLEAAGAKLGRKLDEVLNGGGSKKHEAKKKKAAKKRR